MAKFDAVAAWAWKLPDVQPPLVWAAAVAEFLAPVAALGATIQTEPKKLVIAFADGQLLLEESERQVSRGLIHPGSAAGWQAVCLLALGKRFGGLELVDEEQAPIQSIRKSVPMFANDWEKVSAIATSLDLWVVRPASLDRPGVVAHLF
jgi:hypothetical protein